MTETASLVIKVDSSSAAKATANLDKLDKAAGNTERAANKVGKAWGVALGLISSAVVIGATKAFIQQADAFANMSAKLKLVTGSTQAATKAQRDLFELSQRTSSDLAGTTELYVRLGQSSKALAADHERLLGVTELVSQSMVVSGASTSEAASAVRQFTQAIASGLLRGDEFNSIMENSPRLARAMADGLGVPIGALRKMAEQGELTADKVIKAVESQGAAIDREFGEMPLTVSRATQQVKNALQQMIGETDKAAGASKDLAEAIASMARVLESDSTKRGFASVVSGLASIIQAGGETIGMLALLKRKIEETFATSASDISYQGLLEARMKLADKLAKAESSWTNRVGAAVGANSLADDLRGQLAALDATIEKRRAADAKASRFDGVSISVGGGRELATSATARPTADPKATAGIRDRTTATKELTAAEKEWADFQEAMNDIQEVWNEGERDSIKLAQDKQDAIDEGRAATDDLIKDMEFELDLIGMTNKQREVAIAQRYADKNATDEQRESITRLAEATYDANESMGKQIELMDSVRDAGSDLFVDIANGVKPINALKDAWEGVHQKILQMIAENLMGQLFGQKGDPGGGSAGGWLGSLFGALMGGGSGGGGGGGSAGSIMDLFGGAWGYDGGGYTGAGGRKQPAGIVHKGEVVFSQDDVSRAGGVGAVEAMRRGGGKGGTTNNNITINVPITTEHRSASQIALATSRAMQIAGVRS